MSNRAIQLSIQYIQSGDLDRAEQTVRQLLRENSGHVQGWCLLGLICQTRGRPEEAITLFYEALRLNPQAPEPYNHIGAIYLQLRQPDQAIVSLEQALRLHPFYPEAYNNLGKGYLLLQRVDEALSCFREAIHLHPNFMDAVNNLALLLIARREFDEARLLLERVVQADPHSPGGLISLSMLHFEQGNLAEALATVRRAVQRNPQMPGAQGQLGAVLLKLGRHEEAIEALQTALQLNPNDCQAMEHLGLALMAQGQQDEAVARLKQAVELDSTNVRVLNNLFTALVNLGRWSDVEPIASRLLQLQPNSPDILHNLGLAYLRTPQTAKALAPLEQALKLKPNDPNILATLGWAFHDARDYHRAEEVLQQALRLRPNFPEALDTLGLVCAALGKLDEACVHYEQALQLRPDSALSLGRAANVYRDIGRIDDALACCRKSLAIDPYQSWLYSNFLFYLHSSPTLTPEEIFQEHLTWARYNGIPPVPLRPHPNDRDPNRRLRLGYVSADFCHHVMGRYVEIVLAAHDRERFEVFCYSNVTISDDSTQRLQKLSDHWRHIHNVPDEAVENLIRHDGIDLLIDLNGHTGGNRLQLFARKPAPVQASHFGYMDTTGLTAIDYRITDSVCDPPGTTERYHTEQLVRLPEILWCYHPYLSLEVNDLPATTAGGVTFGVLNGFQKTSTPAIAAWATILSRLPQARLLVLAGASPGADQRLRDAFTKQGINADRLALVGRRSRPAYFQLFHEVDVMLDPFPYTGCNTTCDSLWMGVPAVTLVGTTCMARQGASPLALLGLHDLITHTPEEYVETAVRLAEDLPRLNELRRTLRERMSQSTLMNPERFTPQLEEAYRWMWHQWCQRYGNESPQ